MTSRHIAYIILIMAPAKLESGELTNEVVHQAVVPARIGAPPEVVDPSVLAFLTTCAVADVCDAVGPLYTMSPRIRPLYVPMTTVAGVAVTVKTPPADNLTIHGALNMMVPDSMLVVDWHGYRDGCGSGAQSVLPAMARGLRGIVIDGGWRDVEELREFNLPVFGVSLAASSPRKQDIGEINVAVSCGDVVVEPADVIVAGEAGIAVIPRRALDVVVMHLEKLDRRSAREQDRDGLDQAAESRFRRFEALVKARAVSDERNTRAHDQ
jgi:4-hydroxy-4-methyl-2-oxoglutarate aldolase